MSDLTIPDVTRLAQSRAADPRASAWVSANAGSGKTFVLSRRVVRLLLDGAEPSRILSLTFTKAAAANMATRVFEILGAWVALDDEALSREIRAIEGETPSADRLARARRLFARAVETPGGLKIQTIHAFCERLLHLFPFEANVSASFEVLDDAAGAELLGEARRGLIAHAALHPGSAEAQALSAVEEAAGESGFDALLREALSLKAFLRSQPKGRDGVAAYRTRLAAALGVDPAETPSDIAAAMIAGAIPPSEWPAVAAALRHDGVKTEAGYADSLDAATRSVGVDEKATCYSTVYLIKSGEARAESRFLTKGFRQAQPALSARLDEERLRVAALADRRRAILALDRSTALLTLAASVVRRYEAAKAARGALDFDDLVARTVQLLARSEAAWVLYKLDQGVDHVLVDEAQDTSEVQWDILRRLTSEFTAGARGASPRTIFAVGDPKQSIFSFQGADPRAFEAARRHFADLYGQLHRNDPTGGWTFNDVKLTLSFRSAPDVLSAVDSVFAVAAHARGLSFEDGDIGTTHESARRTAPGLVEIWDPIQPVVAPEPDAWSRPLDEPGDEAPPVRLARRIAATIDRWRTVGDASGRIVPPGDVLILVRSRNAFFEAMIRALKQRRVPVAGADRLALTSHIAVMDLMALGRASLLPQDDLTLAAVLKSPLLGVSEDELLDLAARRTGSLAGTLARRTEPRWTAVQERLERWRTLARSAGPFGFYARLLGPDSGRRAILARLGAEAGDAIDEFLRLALDHEQRRTPSLALFLSAVEAADLVVKRDMEAGRGEVRVMTVHGAKGLEAPVVFLADTCTVPRNDAKLLPLADLSGGPDLPVWSQKAVDPERLKSLRLAAEDRMREEYHRLLYVGMTRAKDRLVIAGFETLQGRGKDSWYDMIDRSLGAIAVQEPDDLGEGTVRRLQTIPFTADASSGAEADDLDEALPDWLRTAAPAEAEPDAPLRPSGALSAADAPRRPVDTPFARDARAAGTLVHALLEILPSCPPPRRAAMARALADSRGGAIAPERRATIVADVLALLGDPRLDVLFGPDSRAEAPVAGTIAVGPAGRLVAVSGQIDRLAVTADEVIIADYKTSARPPADVAGIPESHVGQLAVYRALAQGLFPGRRVRCLVVWTAAPSVMDVPDDRLDAALARIKAA